MEFWGYTNQVRLRGLTEYQGFITCGGGFRLYIAILFELQTLAVQIPDFFKKSGILALIKLWQIVHR
jgi:hypothetical protein